MLGEGHGISLSSVSVFNEFWQWLSRLVEVQRR